MKGNIYTAQKCSVCGGKMVHDERRDGCFCLVHPDIGATAKFYVKYGRGIRKQFSQYVFAARFLTGLRFEDDKGTLDQRDYRADMPLGFGRLAEEFIEEKMASDTLSLDYKRKIETRLKKAIIVWGDRNVKSIKRRDIMRFLQALEVKSKTRADYRSVINQFFNWLASEEILRKDQLPDIPVIEFELGWRKLTDWETQSAVKDEVWRLTEKINPKIHFGIDLLSTYSSLRPADLLRLEEGAIDVRRGLMLFLNPTKKKNQSKTVLLLDEHVDTFKRLKQKFPALPNVMFFRHHGGIKTVKVGQPFGEKYFYKWWVKACQNIGLEGVDLYGGTRHTTVTELAKLVGPTAAKEASGHMSKAFERYCQLQGEREFELSKLVRRAQSGVGEVVNFKQGAS